MAHNNTDVRASGCAGSVRAAAPHFSGRSTAAFHHAPQHVGGPGSSTARSASCSGTASASSSASISCTVFAWRMAIVSAVSPARSFASAVERRAQRTLIVDRVHPRAALQEGRRNLPRAGHGGQVQRAHAFPSQHRLLHLVGSGRVLVQEGEGGGDEGGPVRGGSLRDSAACAAILEVILPAARLERRASARHCLTYASRPCCLRVAVQRR